ncbi:putative RNA-directed DNA polymerase [Dioscorea sansibarensis]
MIIVDDCTRFSWVYFLHHNSQALESFKTFKQLVETQTGCKLKALRTDRGGEFTSKEFSQYLNACGVQRHLTNPRTPEQNGLSEQKIRTVIEMARSMTKERNVPTYLGGGARGGGVATAVYLINISPTTVLQSMAPFEALKGSKPSVEHLKIFGCVAYSLVNPQ